MEDVLARGRFRGALLGLACGDAVGATVEFKARGTFAPLLDMVGGGPFRLEAGRWTDDTSMALCLAESLIACKGMDLGDQMRRYVAWYRRGVWSSKGYCFDIGVTTREALERFEASGEPRAGSVDPNKAGNGSIMRLAPVAMLFANDAERAAEAAKDSSATTHGATECSNAAKSLARTLVECLNGRFDRAGLASYRQRPATTVRGSGYVVESLDAAIWSFANGENFEQCILTAANLGDDADTTAAICGQMAGAYWGVRGIPEAWRERCYRAAEIISMADSLYELSSVYKPSANYEPSADV